MEIGIINGLAMVSENGRLSSLLEVDNNVGCLHPHSLHAGKVGPVWVLNAALAFGTTLNKCPPNRNSYCIIGLDKNIFERKIACLFDLILYFLSTIFQIC